MRRVKSTAGKSGKSRMPKKILLGGLLPSGDPIKIAQLHYAAQSIHQAFPKVELQIAGENGVPAYGFPGDASLKTLAGSIRQYDAVGWIGAPFSAREELSPGVELLKLAAYHGVFTFAWGIASSPEGGLPLGETFSSNGKGSFYRLFSPWVKLFSWVCKSFRGESQGGDVDRMLEKGLRHCRFAALADQQFLNQMRRFDRNFNGIAGANVLPAGDFFTREGELIAVAFADNMEIPSAAAALLKHLSTQFQARFLLVPESSLGRPRLEALVSDLAKAGAAAQVYTFNQVEELLGALSYCSLVISNSFPVSFLALNRLIPVIGVACSGKLHEYLGRYRLPAFETLESDFEQLTDRATLLLEYGPEFREAALPVRELQLKELSAAERALGDAFRCKSLNRKN